MQTALFSGAIPLRSKVRPVVTAGPAESGFFDDQIVSVFYRNRDRDVDRDRYWATRVVMPMILRMYSTFHCLLRLLHFALHGLKFRTLGHHSTPSLIQKPKHLKPCQKAGSTR